MGKLMDQLKRQVKSADPEHKEYAEDCIKLYNWIKSTDKDGCVWSSRWQTLTDVIFLKYPYKIYKPNITGYTVLKGLKEN